MRIDEFSNAGDIDGTLSTTEITRFMLVGFDLAPAALTIYSTDPDRIFTPPLDCRVCPILTEDRTDVVPFSYANRNIIGE